MRTYPGSVLEQAPNLAEVSRTLEAGRHVRTEPFPPPPKHFGHNRACYKKGQKERERSVLRSFGFSQPDDED